MPHALLFIDRLSHFSSVSVLNVSTAAGPSARRFPSSLSISRDDRRGPFPFLPMGKMGRTSILLPERSRKIKSERELIVSGMTFRLLALRSRFVRAVLSPTTSGTCVIPVALWGQVAQGIGETGVREGFGKQQESNIDMLLEFHFGFNTGGMQELGFFKFERAALNDEAIA